MREVRRRAVEFTVILLMLAEPASAAEVAVPSPKSVNARLSELFPDPVIVRGKGVEVKRSQLEDAFVTYRANLAARDQTIPEEQRPLREAQLLDRFLAILGQLEVRLDTVLTQCLAQKHGIGIIVLGYEDAAHLP